MNRYITPSLAELSGRGRLPYMYKHVLMLTRVPGAGGELMVLLLQRLQGYNAFKHIRLPSGDHGLLSTLQQVRVSRKSVYLGFDCWGKERGIIKSQFDRSCWWKR